VLGLVQRFMKGSGHIARGGFDHALKYIFYVVLQAHFRPDKSPRLDEP
jgi:hypothetical protein